MTVNWVKWRKSIAHRYARTDNWLQQLAISNSSFQFWPCCTQWWWSSVKALSLCLSKINCLNLTAFTSRFWGETPRAGLWLRQESLV